MFTPKTRLQYVVYGFMLLGLTALLYGFVSEIPPFILIGVTAILGAGYAILSQFTASSLAVMFGGLSISSILGVIFALVINEYTILMIAYLLMGIAAGIRSRQYWNARPWTLKDSG